MEQDRNRGARAAAWAPIVARAWRRTPSWAQEWAHDLSRFLEEFARHLQEWAIADTGPGRLVPWLPVAFGLGIAFYFSAQREPVWWAGLSVAIAAATSAIALRARPVAFPIALAVAAIAAGFTTATFKSLRVEHAVLAAPVNYAEVSGFVENREERERTDRFLLRVHSIDAGRSGVTLQRVRLSVRKGMAPIVGSFVTLRARLNPPLRPLRPGGYDFARDMYFQGIGATGFVLGQIKVSNPPYPANLWLTYASAIHSMRDAIDARIRSVISGDRGAIASALITGKRDAISAPVNDAMYVSSLAHVLSISGYHMAVVAGVVFFVIRASLALIPAFASRYPIKKWAALAAIVVAAFYLLLSGSEVATQRAFIMTAIVLIGVMFDRPALTLRTIAVAALAVLLVAPQALVHPSFQMSFAATLALIAVYERGLPWFSVVPETPLATRIALWGGREAVALILASIVAGLATTLFAAFHFHRLAPYGVIANLLAMPIVSIWVMPAGLLGLLAIPFGMDGFFWRLMGDGIDWMIAAALWVASLPGAVGRVAAFGMGPLMLGTSGLVVLCLLRTPVRFAGAALLVLATVWAGRPSLPDIRIAPEGNMVAVRNADGRLSIMKSRNDDFTAKEWLAADGDARAPRDESLSANVRCDGEGCVATLPDQSPIALSLTAEALAEDCSKAALIVTTRNAPAGCAAFVVDRNEWRASGAIDIMRTGKAFDVVRANPEGHDRPWARRPQTQDRIAPVPADRPASRDATPRSEDVETSEP
jgi:competence protein ComEC